MNHSLFIVDLAGKFFGCLAALTIAIYVSALLGIYGQGPGFAIADFLCVLFVFLKLLEFLSPGRFETKMLNTETRSGRLLFHVSNFAFILACAYLLRRNGVAETLNILRFASSWGAYLILAALLTFGGIFASGLAFRTYSTYSHDILIGAVEAPETGADYRHFDLIDKVCLILPALLFLIPAGLSFVSNTIPTPKYYRWEETNEVYILMVLVGLPAIAAVITALRGPFQRSNGETGSSFMICLLCVAMTVFSYFSWTTLARQKSIPTAINLVSFTDDNSGTYIIRRSFKSEAAGQCIELEPLGAPDIAIESCGHKTNPATPFVAGATIEFTGKLTSFGHTLESYRINP